MTIRADAAWRAGVALCVGMLLRPSDAAAHLVTTGMGPVYDGIGHLLLTLEDLVPVLALALFAGLRGAAQGRRAMFLLPLAWLTGGLIGLRVTAGTAFPVPAVSFLILGALVAADLRLPANGVAVLAVVLGLVHGVLNGAPLRQGAGGLGLLGIMAALFVSAAWQDVIIGIYQWGNSSRMMVKPGDCRWSGGGILKTRNVRRWL